MFEGEVTRRKSKIEEHRVIKVTDFSHHKEDYKREQKEVFANPVEYEDVATLAMIYGAVENVIDAVEKGYIQAELSDDGKTVKMEFLPLEPERLPKELGHMFDPDETHKAVQGLKDINSPIFGDNEGLTYLQTIDFVVEGFFSSDFYGSFAQGKKFIRLYFDRDLILEERDIYLDPEAIACTPEEYPMSFVVKGGVPKRSLKKGEQVSVPPRSESDFNDFDMADFPTDEEVEAQTQKNKKKLIDFFTQQKKKKLAA
ncbi:hypothetical protein HQ571_00430 [Candidatus Kuenenbacteria bacterium]|nr:hypothetical protein [Candidatus Kuenenbacteria bacterium]